MDVLDKVRFAVLALLFALAAAFGICKIGANSASAQDLEIQAKDRFPVMTWDMPFPSGSKTRCGLSKGGVMEVVSTSQGIELAYDRNKGEVLVNTCPKGTVFKFPTQVDLQWFARGRLCMPGDQSEMCKALHEANASKPVQVSIKP